MRLLGSPCLPGMVETKVFNRPGDSRTPFLPNKLHLLGPRLRRGGVVVLDNPNVHMGIIHEDGA